MKKSVLMSLVVLAIVGTSAVFAQQPTLDKLTFTGSEARGFYAAPLNKSISGAVVIPGTYNNSTVTNVWNFAETNITSVIILDGVKNINNVSFINCKELTSVTIPASVTGIDSNAFAGCTNLTSFTIQSSQLVSYASLPGDLNAKYKAGGPGTYTRQAGSNTWTKVGGFSLNGTWTRSDGMQITITENGQNITITGNLPNNGGRLNKAYTER